MASVCAKSLIRSFYSESPVLFGTVITFLDFLAVFHEFHERSHVAICAKFAGRQRMDGRETDALGNAPVLADGE